MENGTKKGWAAVLLMHVFGADDNRLVEFQHSKAIHGPSGETRHGSSSLMCNKRERKKGEIRYEPN